MGSSLVTWPWLSKEMTIAILRSWNEWKIRIYMNSIIGFQVTFLFFRNWHYVCIHIYVFSSVTQPCPTLCDPMNRSTPGLPVHYQLLEFTQTHVHRVGDAIQPSHPLSSPSPAPSTSQHQSLFQWVNSSHKGGQSTGVSALASVLPMNTQDRSPSEWTGWISLQSKGLSRVLERPYHLLI